MSSIEKHVQWPAIKEIHKKLTEAGHRALIAGGAVRDLLLDEVPRDLDIATDATPDQVEDLFEKTVMVGKAFGVSRVVLQDQDIEVATFRKDGTYKDGRHPESVEFSDDKEDALRRDFTINAMFYDIEKKEIIDHVGGQKDIMSRTLRTVGKAVERFEEDKLRVLRALRFHSQLGFTIDKETQEAMAMWAHKLDQVSMERIRDEWGKLLLGPGRLSAIEKSHDLKIFHQLFKNWKYQPLAYAQAFKRQDLDLYELWTLWFLTHLNETRESIAEAGIRWRLTKEGVRQMIFCFDQMDSISAFGRREAVDVAIFMGTPRGAYAVKMYKILRDPRPKKWEQVLKDSEIFFENGKLPDPVVTGDDLIKFGMAPGPDVAKGLKTTYRHQLKFGETNKEKLMKSIMD